MNRGKAKVFFNRWKENVSSVQFIVTLLTLFVVLGLSPIQMAIAVAAFLLITVAFTYVDYRKLLQSEWEQMALLNPVSKEILENTRKILDEIEKNKRKKPNPKMPEDFGLE